MLPQPILGLDSTLGQFLGLARAGRWFAQVEVPGCGTSEGWLLSRFKHGDRLRDVAEAMCTEPTFPSMWAIAAVKHLGRQMTEEFRQYFWRKIGASTEHQTWAQDKLAVWDWLTETDREALRRIAGEAD